MEKKQKFLNNKGFSLVELIIVIAIMAILAGVLAPQLMRYIERSRRSTDVQTAQTIATAVGSALADEAAFTAAADTLVATCFNGAATRNDFQVEVQEIIGGTIAPNPRSAHMDDYFIDVDTVHNTFEIYAVTATEAAAGTFTPANRLYPTVGANFTN